LLAHCHSQKHPYRSQSRNRNQRVDHGFGSGLGWRAAARYRKWMHGVPRSSRRVVEKDDSEKRKKLKVDRVRDNYA